MSVVKLSIGQTHKCPTATSVAKAVNLGGPSALIKMALDPKHRATVERYREDAVWQAIHCSERSDAHDKDKWWRIAEHISAVMVATRSLKEAREVRAAWRAAQ